ncbi:unnamed protein product [Soboliphyme baturini]|uniref:Integrase n=1 Tax=Soboliphyme baturini TaxID=241478 RepID=A0A183J7Q2_9BILA|nr:unnamed protein product [Soboliphyme baturini]
MSFRGGCRRGKSIFIRHGLRGEFPPGRIKWRGLEGQGHIYRKRGPVLLTYDGARTGCRRPLRRPAWQRKYRFDITRNMFTTEA